MLPIVLSSCLVFFLGQGIAEASELFQAPKYHYKDDKLHLKIWSPKEQQTKITWIGVNDQGRLTGDSQKKIVDLELGENTVDLKVKDVSGHRVRFRLSGTDHHIWANRGTWYSLPKIMSVADIRKPNEPVPLSRAADIQLARGFGSVIGRLAASEPHLTLGRTLGYESGYGITVKKDRHAFLLIANGTVGPIKLTVGQRLSKTKFQYWDYYMVISPTMKRYVIPLDRFTRRGRSSLPFKSIHSIAIRSLHPVEMGDKMYVGYVGLARPGPTLADVRPAKDGYTAIVRGSLQHDAVLSYRKRDGKKVDRPVKKSRVFHLPKKAEKAWLCYNEDPVGPSRSKEEKQKKANMRICDPADAPHASFRVPTGRNQTYVLDNFDTLTHVNPYHIPIIVFGSTTPVERDIKFRRTGHSITVTVFPLTEDDYGGYITYFPQYVPEGFLTLELSVRGRVPPEEVRVGIRDISDREARVSLRSYLKGEKPVPCFQTGQNLDNDGDPSVNDTQAPDCEETVGAFLGLERDDIMTTGVDFRKVKIPLEAFRAIMRNSFVGKPNLDKFKSVSLTMLNGGVDVAHQIEIEHVHLTGESVPITIACFDGERKGLTALGGVIVVEGQSGGRIDAQFDAEGYEQSKGLRVEVSNQRPEGYGLVALSLGRIDASAYTNLTFNMRGTRRSDSALIFMTDGKNRVSVNLKDYTDVAPKWRQVMIPLSAFSDKDVDLKNLTQIILVWQGQNIDREVLYFDDFILE